MVGRRAGRSGAGSGAGQAACQLSANGYNSAMSDAAKEPQTFKKSVVREYAESIVVAVILALFIRTFVVQAFKIPTGSMETNLLIGDHLLVNKLVYSPSCSPIENLLLAKKGIQRGHVVVFKYPNNPNKDFIKRVIALPGEKVEIRDKVVYINGRALDEPYVHFTEPLIRREDPLYGLQVQDGVNNWGPRVVPEGHLFMLGDNRDNSQDSRYWGFLPISLVKGRALLVYWSYSASRGEYQTDNKGQWLKDTVQAFGKTRWTRFFHLVR